MKHYNIITRQVIIWAALLFIFFYVYAYIFINPYTGLMLQPVPNGWQVQFIEACADPCPIQLGDIVTQVGDVSFKDTLSDKTKAFFGGYKINDTMPILVLRGSEIYSAHWMMPEPPSDLLLQRILILLFVLPFVLFALFTEYLLPRSRGQTLLVAGFLSYAAFIAAGLLSPTLVAGSSLALHATVWVAVIIMIELHWHLPVPLSKRLPYRRWFYAGTALMISLELMQALPWRFFYLAVLIQILVCTGLLLWRIARGVAARQSIIMMTGMWLAWLPGMLWMSASYEINAPDLIYTTIVTMMFLVWPIFYLYANYRHSLGRMEGAARKAIIITAFSSMALGVLAITLVMLGSLREWTPYQIVEGTVIGSTFALVIAITYGKFDRWANDRLYGRLDRELSRLSSSLFTQLPSLTQADVIHNFLSNELGKALLIEQMALYYKNEGELCLFFSQGCSLPETLEAPPVCENTASPFSLGNSSGQWSWTRASLPMTIGSETVGCFFIGAREDDDYYAPRHITELQHIINGLAAAMELNQQRASLRTQLDVIVEQERMAALGRLAANIAHQINNPLQVITGALDAHSGFSETGPTDQYLKVAYEKTAYLSDIVRSITQFVHPGHLATASVDVNECVESVLPLVHEKLRENNVSVNLRLAAWLPPTQMSRSDLPQVLTNLVENACDAMAEEGGNLGIETAVDTDREHIIIRVTDTGIGITKGQMLRLFEPFYTTKPEGTGFGLSIAYSIIERNNGRLSVASEPGRGSTFTIQLPTEVRETKYGNYFDRR